ncbi:hypothetical protein [Vibrio parahaemolyticus]|uniref:hypothetical protein n=1 Tax=Vibrio parahaemolyticus TaxID=670 RepID=UPI001A8DED74|nr:hypothetical protein [Vibrio parahaemolyticus]MBO0236456.1 hypothetical protein [Vibrio parahaemolyticus]
MQWWKKTVEYRFVADTYSKKMFNLLAPLDGDVERIGDAVAAKDSKYYIIEFKKSLSELSGEYKKYPGGKGGYLEAAATMAFDPSSKSHFMIGGVVTEANGKPILKLEIKHYFNLSSEVSLKLEDILVHGLSLDELKKYTSKFTSMKLKDSDGSSSGGSGQFSSVVAVSQKAKKATFIPLHYFNKPELKLTNTHRPTGP